MKVQVATKSPKLNNDDSAQHLDGWPLKSISKNQQLRRYLRSVMQKALLPTRSPKLSNDEPVQYLDGRPLKLQ